MEEYYQSIAKELISLRKEIQQIKREKQISESRAGESSVLTYLQGLSSANYGDVIYTDLISPFKANDIAIGSNLNVIGSITGSSQSLSGTLSVSGDTSASNLTVSGTNGLSVTNDSSFGGNLTCNGTIFASKSSGNGIQVTAAAFIGGNMSVMGTTNLGNLNSSITSVSTLSTSGLATLSSLKVNGNSDLANITSTGLTMNVANSGGISVSGPGGSGNGVQVTLSTFPFSAISQFPSFNISLSEGANKSSSLRISQNTGTGLGSRIAYSINSSSQSSFPYGIFLPTTNGTQTLLAYNEVNTFTLSCSGPFSAAISITCYFSRIGNSVCINFSALSGTATTSTKITGSLPTRLSPYGTPINEQITVINSGAVTTGAININGTTVTFGNGLSNANFTGSGTCGFQSFSVSYAISTTV